MITFQSHGSFKRTESFLNFLGKGRLFSQLESYAQEGVSALSSATPRESGATAAAWDYEVSRSRGGCTISWVNRNTNGGVNIAIILQYGHGTGTGGYVAGRDYINPAIKPVFDRIADKVWKAVTSA